MYFIYSRQCFVRRYCLFVPDDVVQVCVHELEDEVEVPVVLRAVHVEQLDDVGVVGELLQEDDFAEGPLRVRLVAERVEDLLHSHHAPGPAV